MCMDILTRKHYIAKKDLNVLKVVYYSRSRNEYESPYYCKTKWKPGSRKVHREKLKTEYGVVYKGYHSFFDSFMGRQAARSMRNGMCNPSAHRIIKLVVPKGAEYIVGTGQQLVSNRIRWPRT